MSDDLMKSMEDDLRIGCSASIGDTQKAVATLKAQAAEIARLRAALKWDIERDGDDLLICEGDHERHEGCIMQRWVKAENVATARREGMEEARTIFNEAIEGTTLEGTILMRQIDAAIRAAAGEGK